ncbi:MAG: hypothetical protein IJU84_03425 [Clostridia bacterium]|nr:hypothetical protein [Clostridia bacterium]
MKKTLICFLFGLFAAFFFVSVFTVTGNAEGAGGENAFTEVNYSDILRGARSNVNRELMSVNIEDDGVTLGGVFETPAKAIAKAAVRSGVVFTENFTVASETVSADDGVTMDLGFIYGDVDEGWLDPWDFLGIDMSDPGSLAKFRNIGGFTVRFSLKGNSVSTLIMKGSGQDINNAAFAVAGVTQ